MFLSPQDGVFWLYAAYFLAAVFISFFLPGDVLLRKLKLGIFQRVVLGVTLGSALWIWQGFLLGFLNLRILTYVYLIGFAYLWYLQNKNLFRTFKVSQIKIDKILTFLVVLGVVVQILSMWFMGVRMPDGAYFCCGNVKDAVYHIGLTDQIVKNFPPLEPGMSGIVVKNYHYLSNLITADLVRIYHLPLVATQYQFMTVFLSLFLGLTAISFAKSNKMSRSFICWLLFFLYFGGDLIYFVLLLLHKGLSFRMGSLEDGSIFLVNPPRAYAVVMFFGALSLLSLWIRDKRIYTGLLTSLIVSCLIGLKVYIGIFVLCGLGMLGVFYLFSKQIKMCLVLSISFFLSLVFYLPVNQNAGGLYFTGFWLFENFISQPQFDLIRVELARTVYQDHKNHLRVLQYEFSYIAFYCLAIFGTKMLGIFQTRKSLKQLPLPIHIVLITGIITSVCLGFFFQQTSGGSNSFNFTVSVFILGSMYAALAVSFWLSVFPRKVSVILGIIIVGITIPRVVNQTVANVDWVITGKGTYIPNSELEMLHKVRSISHPDAVVLVDNKAINIEHESSIASFIMDRGDYFSGREILLDHNIPIKQREQTVNNIFSAYSAARVLYASGIDYIIINKKTPIHSKHSQYTRRVFENSEGRLLEVMRPELREFIIKSNKK